MPASSISHRLWCILLATLALASLAVQGQDDALATAATTPIAGPQERAYEQAIVEIESSEGAYAGALPESLLSLATTLQSQGRHAEAVALFRRGVHLTRINEGLYCPQQIPLLQGEIASYVAANDFARADERQRYLHRVQMRALSSGDARTEALMQQANWQYAAYQLGLAPQDYIRLMTMCDLYQQALQEVSAREGDKSPKLLPPLQGMLQAQYLISRYQVRELSPAFAEESQLNEALLRFNAYRNDSYQQGNAIIEAIAAVDREHDTVDSKARARTLVMIGDWRLWNGRTEAAIKAYREAETELARGEDAQAQLQQMFGEPVALPAIGDLNPLPPTADPEHADILLAFGVSEEGQVEDLERVDDQSAATPQASRLMRQLRKTTFRPRFAAGQPVGTEKIVKAFTLQ